MCLNVGLQRWVTKNMGSLLTRLFFAAEVRRAPHSRGSSFFCLRPQSETSRKKPLSVLPIPASPPGVTKT